jgi:Protein of unknown function (DUF3619)
MTTPIRPAMPRDAHAMETRFARRISARLSENLARDSHDIDTRLRFARERALARALELHPQMAVSVGGMVRAGQAAALRGPGRGSRWWSGLAAVVPLLVLLGGLALIQWQQTQAQIEVAVDIDEQLLADDLPPAAYTDPGFLEFLKQPAD